MGNVCFKAPDVITKKSPPLDINIPKQTGSHPAIFEALEKINIFKYFNVQDTIYLFLSNFPRSGEGVSETNYYIFIEKKFIRNQQISEWILNDEKLMSEVKDFHSKLFDIFKKGIKQYYKQFKGEKYTDDTLPVLCFLPFAILFASGRNDTKLDIVFNLFCNNDQLLEESDDLHFFIMATMCLPTSITLFVLKLLADENDEYKRIMDKYDFTNIFDTYQIKDACNAAQEYFKELFSNKKQLTYSEFKSLVSSSEDLQSIFHPGNVRKYLEKHNI
jgi:hypothetical protein